MKDLAKALPEYTCTDGYVLKPNAEHILNGYALEITGRGVYVNRFVFPLFDCVEFITLLYSDRVGQFINFETVGKSNVCQHILELITVCERNNEEVHSPGDFIKFFESHPSLQTHPHACLINGFSLALKGDFDSSADMIQSVKDKLPEKYARCGESVLSLLESDPEKAVKRILENELIDRGITLS
ncbi:hypothetical protein C3B51_22975 [Pseudoalteromonas rubra]|uniref:Uncharacterized protein n=2 Tax=Pseudoalteromonas rubra TaxID=43658 RepID=A0A4Q7DYY8_9GAMM|nr:hypothetical protein C3B51_22975 [Pseudoalteromonas rubra]